MSRVFDLERYNTLNATLVSGLPEMARASDTLARHKPLLREMQALLSQRPKFAKPTADFSLLSRSLSGHVVRCAPEATSVHELPTWSQWIRAYAAALDYSVRQIRRVIMNEARRKLLKECGWSASDHNNLIKAATAGFDLVSAIEAGADTTALCDEIRTLMKSVPDDLVERRYEDQPKKTTRLRKRRTRQVTT